MRSSSLPARSVLRISVLAAVSLALAGPLLAQPSLSISGTDVPERNTGSVQAVVTVTLTPAASGVVTVNFESSAATPPATPGAACGGAVDFVSPTGTVRFDPGVTTQTISVVVCSDTADEPNEKFRVRLFGAVGATIATSQGTVTILDDDEPAPVPTVSINDATFVENNGFGTVFTLNLSAPSSQVVEVRLRTIPTTATVGSGPPDLCGGNDVENTSSTQIFDPGSTSQTASIRVCSDTVDEPDETFQVVLSNPVGATLGDAVGVGTIIDDDPPAASLPTISIGDVTVVEGDAGTTEVRFPVTLSAAFNDATVSATYRINPTTATPGRLFGPCDPNVDVVPFNSTVAFLSGTTTPTSEQVIVRICGDTVDEPDETFQIVLSDPFRATLPDPVAVGTIVDDDAATTPLPTLSIRDLRIVEGTGPVGDVVNGVAVDIIPSSDQVVTAAITYNVNPPNNATQGTSCAPNVDFVPAASTVSIRAGALFPLLPISICGDSVDEPDETYQVVLSNPVGATLGDGLATVTIVDDDLGAVIIIPTPPTISIGDDVGVNEGSVALFVLTLSASATQAVTVQFATTPGRANAGTTCASVTDYLTRSGTVTFPPGTTRRGIGVQTCDDFRGAESPETFFVRLSSPVNATIARFVGTGTIRE